MITRISYFKSYLSDTLTPVSAYLRLRDRFAGSILLESTDFHGNENSFSYICCNPYAGIAFHKGRLTVQAPFEQNERAIAPEQLSAAFNEFIERFHVPASPVKGVVNDGLFGYLSYNASHYLSKNRIQEQAPESSIPELCYKAYQFVIAINHFSNKVYIFNNVDEATDEAEALSQIDEVYYQVVNRDVPSYRFRCDQAPTPHNESGFDELFKTIQYELFEQDIHSVVLAQRYTQAYQGDDFNLYRAVRSQNPSPYLYYFDYGNFRLMGSSFETQVSIKNATAEISLLQGTIDRSGNDEQDLQKAYALAKTIGSSVSNQLLSYAVKEELKHTCVSVDFAKQQQINTYAHVLQIVTEIRGQLKSAQQPAAVLLNTFPSARHAGYPKQEALELIHKHEQDTRNYFGGSIGFIGFDGSLNHALLNKAFLCKDDQLEYYFEAIIDKQTDLDQLKNSLEQRHEKPAAAIQLAKEL